MASVQITLPPPPNVLKAMDLATKYLECHLGASMALLRDCSLHPLVLEISCLLKP